MIYFLPKIAFFIFLSALAEASNPYCVHNESIVTRIPVTKTRQVLKKPSGFFKAFKKSKVYTETYTDYEEHVELKVVTTCCEGYERSKLKLCDPICEGGCPKNARCIEPNICECQSGYISAVSPKDGSHHCKPTCNGGCPANSRCAEPDVCECEKGFHKIDNACKPRCSKGCGEFGTCIAPEKCQCIDGFQDYNGTCVCADGYGCQNGYCDDKFVCVCKWIYTMNLVLNCKFEICENEICAEYEPTESSTTISTLTENEVTQETYFPDSSDEDDADDYDLDSNERIFLDTTTSYYYHTDDDSDDKEFIRKPKCNSDENDCSPQIFASNGADCRIKPCTANAYCQKNGTCVCMDGFRLHKLASSESSVAIAHCLTLTEINELVELETDWWSACFIALGVLCMLGAFGFLIVKLFKRNNEKLDVEAKNDLYCTYDNKNFSDNPQVL